MSEPLRVAAAVEGPTDAIVLQAILDTLLEGTEFELQILQPEGSVSFAASRGGWGGVYRWCRQSVDEGGGSVSGSRVLSNHDLLIVQVDADIAGKTYASAGIRDAPSQDIPCHRPCPPPSDTTNALRTVVLGWLGESHCPSQVVLCTPSMNIDAWVVASVWPNNPVVTRGNWECHSDPASQLGALPKGQRFRKHVTAYRAKQKEMSSAWRNVSATLTEAKRFENEFRAALPCDVKWLSSGRE